MPSCSNAWQKDMDFAGEYGNWKGRKKGRGYSTDRIEWEWVENRGNLTRTVVERNPINISSILTQVACQ